MADFLSDNTTWLAVVLGLLAVAYGIGLTVYLLKQPAGDERMREIAAAVQEGAQAYLKRQYTIIAGVAVVLFVLIGVLGSTVDSSLLGWKAAIGFLIGAVGLGRRRLHRHERLGAHQRAHRRGRQGRASSRPSASPSRAARSPGLLVVGLGLLSVSGYFLILGQDAADVKPLVGLAFGGSLISVFARLGGGIFTKGADVGADLVGKVEAGHPRGRPAQPGRHRRQRGRQRRRLRRHGRRPLRDLRRHHGRRHVPRLAVLHGATSQRTPLLYPLALGGVSIIASIIGTWFVRRRQEQLGHRGPLHGPRRGGDPRDRSASSRSPTG